jgi:hypothetical protein
MKLTNGEFAQSTQYYLFLKWLRRNGHLDMPVKKDGMNRMVNDYLVLERRRLRAYVKKEAIR